MNEKRVADFALLKAHFTQIHNCFTCTQDSEPLGNEVARTEASQKILHFAQLSPSDYTHFHKAMEELAKLVSPNFPLSDFATS